MENMTIEGAWANIEAMPFSGKLNFYRAVNQFANSQCGMVKYDGYLCADSNNCVQLGDGRYYVYVWKHNYGDIFYVGSGQGERWKVINPRCNEFYNNLDRADAIVYKVVSGLNEIDARRCERYLSVNLANAGFSLANHDFNCEHIPTDFSTEVKDVAEKVIFDIINKEHPQECHKTMVFLKEYGEHYFSEKYKRDRAKEPLQECSGS